MNKTYAGIGSRETPMFVLELMMNVAYGLALKGYELRSGGADGSDTYFEVGCDKSKGKKSIFLPWRLFNGNNSKLYEVSEEALEMAKKYHPVWDKLSQGAKKLMGRNTYQVLGLDLKTPCDFIICWTKNGKKVGGTAQALRMAEDYNIPVFNFGCYKTKEEMIKEFKIFIKQFC